MAALIGSLIREQRAAEDRAIFDAYQNGGKFQGKVVDDAAILKYIKGRRDGFSSDDPLYDEWNNRLIQTDFSIGEQKVGLAFKEGRVGAGAVASFYRGQLKKIPRNSAFYRTVAGRAAEWAKSAVGAARGRARGRATSGVRSQLNGEIAKAQSYLGLERALTDYAKRMGVIGPNDRLTDADATELQEMFSQGIYSGKDRITFSEFQSAATGYMKNLDRQVTLQVRLGNQGTEARNRRDKHLYGTLLKLNAVDDRAGYELLRERWLDDLNSANGDPYAISEANKKYAEGLKTIHGNATKVTGTKTNDPEFISGIAHEFNAVTTGKATGPTVAEQYGEENDAADTAEAVTRTLKEVDLLDTNKAYYGQTEPGGNFGVVEWPKGLGGDPLGLDDSLQPSIQVVNGVRRTVYMKGREISSSAIRDLNTGEVVPFEAANIDAIREGLRTGEYKMVTGNRVGYTFTNPITGKTIYGVNDPATGQMIFTEENPFASDIVGAGDEQLVFTDSVTVNREGDIVPDAQGVFTAPPSIATGGSPVLSDGSVSPKDLLNLLNKGEIDVPEDQFAAYRARLEREARYRSGDFARDRSYDPANPSSPTDSDYASDSPSERARDRRAGVMSLPDVSSLVPNLQSLFRDPGGKDDTFLPPPPPRPPVPLPTPTSAPRPSPSTPRPPSGGNFTGIPTPSPSEIGGGTVGNVLGDAAERLRLKREAERRAEEERRNQHGALEF